MARLFRRVCRFYYQNVKREFVLFTQCMLLMFCAFIVIAGCAPVKGEKVLLPDKAYIPNYSSADKKAIFNDGEIAISLEQLGSSDLDDPFIIELQEQGFVILRLEIESLSKKRIIYNPSFTSLVDNKLGYNRPLDYTDLYELVKEREDPEQVLSGVSKRFYDLSVTIGPYKKESRFIIFRSLEEKSTTALLSMREVYVGVETMMLNFPFVLKVLKNDP